MHISLQTHQENQSLSFSEFKRDSYVCAFTLNVKSGNFTGMVAMSHYDTIWLDDFVSQLQQMEARAIGGATLEDEQGNSVTFTLDHLGHLEVSGHLRECTNTTQKLDFAFMTDQTCLRPFISELTKVLDRAQD